MTDALEGGLPRAVAISWGMVANPQRGPKRELSHERIVETAIELADAEGLGAVTMSKVATALGFTTMALYRYVTSKDDLLELMLEACAGEVLAGTDRDLDDGRSGVSTADWRDELRRFATQLRGAYLNHPWIGDVQVSSALLLTPNNLAIADLAMRSMRGLAVSDLDKTGVLLLITNYVRASSLQERDVTATDQQRTSIAGELIKELVTEERFPDLAPMVASGVYLPGSADQAKGEIDDFGFGLEIILDGIAAHAERSGTDVVRPEPGWRDDDQVAEALGLDHVRKDAKVKDAISKRREAETRLRDARRHEREMIKNALERGPRK